MPAIVILTRPLKHNPHIAKFREGWRGGLPETPCGYDSKVSETAIQRKWIPKIVEKYGVQTVADIGAGDLNWIKLMEWDVEYQAYDLIPRHESVSRLDITMEVPPCVDLIMCLWVFNHMHPRQVIAALDNIKASGSKYLMFTTSPRWAEYLPVEIDLPRVERVDLKIENMSKAVQGQIYIDLVDLKAL